MLGWGVVGSFFVKHIFVGRKAGDWWWVNRSETGDHNKFSLIAAYTEIEMEIEMRGIGASERIFCTLVPRSLGLRTRIALNGQHMEGNPSQNPTTILLQRRKWQGTGSRLNSRAEGDLRGTGFRLSKSLRFARWPTDKLGHNSWLEPRWELPVSTWLQLMETFDLALN